MAGKLQAYAQLADHTATQITASYQAWTAFLRTAGRLYKYPFPEQLLIYAQRPDATACAEYDFWNERMRRYVRRGSTGIALIDNSGGRPFLRYVFDVADTGGEKGTRPQLWKYREEYQEAVSAALAWRFDVPAGEGGLPEQLETIASQLAADYWEEHRQDMDSKRRVQQYMTDHARDRGTAEWLKDEYGDELPAFPVTVEGAAADLPWTKVQRRLARLVKEDRFFTQAELDDFEDIDPAAIRERLENGGSSAFVDQVMADVERLAGQEAEQDADAVPTVREIYEKYKPIVKDKVLADKTYQNACKNSDKETARMEGDEAVNRAALSIMFPDGTTAAIGAEDFMRLYFDMADFRLRLHREVIDETYPILSQPQQEEVSDTPYQAGDVAAIFCEWSENSAFEDQKTYSVYEFDCLMKQADEEYVAGKTAATALRWAVEARFLRCKSRPRCPQVQCGRAWPGTRYYHRTVLFPRRNSAAYT